MSAQLCKLVKPLTTRQQKNQQCWKISLPKLVDENLAKVELIVDKAQMADSNQHFLNCKLQS